MGRAGRGFGHVAGVGAAVVLVAGALVVSAGERTGAAQDGAAATATRESEEAELTALRTQVAALSTEVARLGGEDAATVAGRLGGGRAGFEAAYGATTAYIGDDQAVYAVEGTGRVTATFEEGRAVRLVVSPDRPVETPSDEPDAADFDLDEARRVAFDFAPSDADLDEFDLEAGDGPVATGTSDALAGDAATADDAATEVAGACAPAGTGGAFSVALTMPTEETVSAVILERVAAPTVAPTPAPAADRDTSGGVTSARVSLSGGSTTVNGIRVEGGQSRREGAGEADGETLAVELEIANATDGDLLLDPSHFVLIDGGDREVPAGCGGVEPSLIGQEIGSGEAARGWVTFRVPERFLPRQVVYFVNGSGSLQIAFILD